ncbi:MAG TPA: GC-type dockerin domain-anchored protein [Phycisphaerales bacterium]|nr:GC-type dockerin domain-anchored protein [Phycisphaerales bacterium]
MALRTHAALWSGTPGSLVDLHPGPETAVHSMIASMDQFTQVGSFLAPDNGGGTFGTGRPCMWSGTAASFIDLTPAGFGSGEARGAFGNQQVGATFDNFLGSACMWYGTAESFVSLNPEVALFSAAQCTDGVHQYGVVGILEPIPGLFPARWSGTAESYEVLDIPSPESRWGEVHAVDSGYAVGYVTDNDGLSNSRACVWTGENADFADIHVHLPANLTESNALGVWRHAPSGTAYIVGYGLNSGTGQREAIMWVNGEGTNLITSAAAPADNSAAAGQPMTYSVRVVNAGPVASGPVTLTVALPASGVAAYDDATPSPATVGLSQLTFSLPSLAGSGGTTDVSITLTAMAEGATAVLTATASSASEADPTNNSDSAWSKIQGTPCAADLGMQGGVAGQDGALDNNDFVVFINHFFGHDTRADVGVQGGVPGRDGAFDNNDFVVFIDLFFGGC